MPLPRQVQHLARMHLQHLVGLARDLLLPPFVARHRQRGGGAPELPDLHAFGPGREDVVPISAQRLGGRENGPPRASDRAPAGRNARLRTQSAGTRWLRSSTVCRVPTSCCSNRRPNAHVAGTVVSGSSCGRPANSSERCHNARKSMLSPSARLRRSGDTHPTSRRGRRALQPAWSCRPTSRRTDSGPTTTTSTSRTSASGHTDRMEPRGYTATTPNVWTASRARSPRWSRVSRSGSTEGARRKHPDASTSQSRRESSSVRTWHPHWVHGARRTGIIHRARGRIARLAAPAALPGRPTLSPRPASSLVFAPTRTPPPRARPSRERGPGKGRRSARRPPRAVGVRAMVRW